MIGSRAMFISALSAITIGDKVLFGPPVTIRCWNRNTREIGRFIYDVREMKAGNHRPVVVSDDVWVGTNVTILAGVTVGRGWVIAAGSLVTRDVPPYCVVGGVPAKRLKWRWSVEEILYPVERRLDKKTIKGGR